MLEDGGDIREGQREVNSGPWKNISVDSQASLLHPLPLRDKHNMLALLWA